MVSIAKEWFGFCPDDRMRVHVDDGIQFIKSESEKGLCYVFKKKKKKKVFPLAYVAFWYFKL